MTLLTRNAHDTIELTIFLQVLWINFKQHMTILLIDETIEPEVVYETHGRLLVI